MAIPPKIAVAGFVGQIKGYASAQYNQNHPQELPFLWQEKYGVFSFDKKRLPNCVSYVENQKDHHKNGSLVAALERTEELPGHQIAESNDAYTFDAPFDR